MLVEPSEDLTLAVTRLIEDEPIRRRLIAAGFEQVRKFSWKRTAAQTLQVLRETTGGR
jgi:glycosyltransferase involved in cell wall biosynthesis